MALTYEFGRIKNYQEVVWIPQPTEENPEAVRLNPVTEALIFGTMAIGIGRFTEKNIAEVAARFRIIEKLHGAMLTKNGEDAYLTDEDFLAHIGLFTNVSEETRFVWARRMFVNKGTSITDEYLRRFHSATKAAA
jgi:hypothetical protein